MSGRRENQRGIALLVTLLAVALMTFVVIDFTYSATTAYRGAANQMNELRADYLARSGVEVGLALLAQDARQATREPYDSLQDLWAAPFPPIEVDAGTAGVSIVDETRKLNINQLVNFSTGAVNQAFAQALARLLANLDVSPEVVPAIVDWLDTDGVPSPGGAESEFYLTLAPPYEPRNGPMPTIGDLRMIRGIDEASFIKLRRVLTVVPDSRVNVNTAPPEVLAALSPDFENSPSLVQAIIEARQEQPFKTVGDLSNVPGVAAIAASLSALLTTQSDFFTVTGMGQYAGARKFVFATVRRNPQGPALLASWHED